MLSASNIQLNVHKGRRGSSKDRKGSSI